MDLTGRVFVVTGASAGIGQVTAHELARQGARVYLACRNKAKTDTVLEAIRKETGNEDVHFVSLDLASLASVKACAQELLAKEPAIHVLLNNAGVAGMRGITKDGFELAFGINHLGHFLLTLLLLDRLKASAPARIVNVSSANHYKIGGIDFDILQRSTASISGLDEYSASKLANVLFTKELARRLEGTDVTAYALHPGVVASDIWKRVPWPVRGLMKLFMISNEEGAATSLYCATSPQCASESGLYYDKCKPKQPNKAAEDTQLAQELWRRSEAWVQPFLQE